MYCKSSEFSCVPERGRGFVLEGGVTYLGWAIKSQAILQYRTLWRSVCQVMNNNNIYNTTMMKFVWSQADIWLWIGCDNDYHDEMRMMMTMPPEDTKTQRKSAWQVIFLHKMLHSSGSHLWQRFGNPGNMARSLTVLFCCFSFQTPSGRGLFLWWVLIIYG